MTISNDPFIKNPSEQQKRRMFKKKEEQALSKQLIWTSGISNKMATIKEPQAVKNPHLEEEASIKKKIRHIKGVVVKAQQETPDTWTLFILVSESDKDYRAGQFISIGPHQFSELADLVRFFEYQKGKREMVRAYSLASAPHEKHLAITIKPEAYEPRPNSFPPLLSPFLASDMLKGREIEFLGYAGAYVMPMDLISTTDHVVHLVAGSGIVPSFSIIKDELLNHKNTHARHTLVNVNRTLADIIFHRELMELAIRYPKRFQIKNYLSQEDPHGIHNESYFHGRPTVENLAGLVRDPASTLIFACGPAITKWQRLEAQQGGFTPKPRFMEWVQDLVDHMGVDKKRFRREVYG